VEALEGVLLERLDLRGAALGFEVVALHGHVERGVRLGPRRGLVPVGSSRSTCMELRLEVYLVDRVPAERSSPTRAYA
jgi:hypothetical protein